MAASPFTTASKLDLEDAVNASPEGAAVYRSVCQLVEELDGMCHRAEHSNFSKP